MKYDYQLHDVCNLVCGVLGTEVKGQRHGRTASVRLNFAVQFVPSVPALPLIGTPRLPHALEVR